MSRGTGGQLVELAAASRRGARVVGRSEVDPDGGAGRPTGWRRRVLAAGGPVLAHVGTLVGADTEDRVVALTFDDGPDPVGTPAVLGALETAGVTATFFVLVVQAEKHPGLLREIRRAGHEVALHGIDHSRLSGRPASEVARLVRDGRRRLEAIVDEPVRWFRPPYGAQTPASYLAARAAGLAVVGWSCWGRDWSDRSGTEVVADALRGTRPGAILLLHDAWTSWDGVGLSAQLVDGGPPRFDRGAVVRELLDQYARRGYSPVSVTGLLAGRRPLSTLWFGS